jgi:tetratricopeptide (TPR) repeat protein
VVPEDLGTPGKIKQMRQSTLLIIVALISVLISACSGTKKVAVHQVPEVAADTITDEKRKEFEYLFVEALKQKVVGNQQRAISLLSSCLEIDPGSSAAMFELANMHLANNDLTSASLLLERAVSNNPANKWYKLVLARVYSQINKFAESAVLYDQLIKAEPENQEYLYMKALMLSSAKKYDEAIRAFSDLEKITGINEQISLSKEQIYLEAGKVKEAFNEIQKLIDFNPLEPRYYGLLADAYLDQGDMENANRYYNRILELDPDNGYVHFSLSNYYRTAGDIEKSFEHTLKGIASQEVDLETKLQLYLMYTGGAEEIRLSGAQTETMVSLLVEAHPDDYRVYTVYAEHLIRNKKWAEARDQLITVTELGVNDYMVWEQILYIDNELQDWSALYMHTNSAIGLFPNQPQFYFFNALACIQLEKFQETISISDEGLLYVVDNPLMSGQLTFIKGEAKYKLGNITEAFRTFDEALELDPENFIALNNYAYYLSLEEVELEKAERMSGKVVERFPDNPTYLDTYAWVLFKKKNYSLAKFYMETALAKGGGENPTLLEHYGDILFMLQRAEEALNYWEKAKEYGGDSELLERKILEKRYIGEKK